MLAISRKNKGSLHAAFSAGVCFDYPFKPDFAPPGINAPRAEHSAIAVTRLAINLFQNDSRRFQCFHYSGLFIYKVMHPRLDAIIFTAIGYQLSVKAEPSMLTIGINSGKNFLERLHPDQLTRLEIQGACWGGLPNGYSPRPSGVWHATAQSLKSIVKPTARPPRSAPVRQATVMVNDIDEALKYASQRCIT